MANVTPPLRQSSGYTAKPVQPRPSQAGGKAGQQAKPRPQTGGVKSSDSNLLAALGYVSTFIVPLVVPIVLYFMKPEDRFVRFHALQAIVLSVALYAVGMVVGVFAAVISLVTFGIGAILIIPIVLLLMPVSIALLLYPAYKAYQGEYYKLPLIGDFCEQHI